MCRLAHSRWSWLTWLLLFSPFDAIPEAGGTRFARSWAFRVDWSRPVRKWFRSTHLKWFRSTCSHRGEHYKFCAPFLKELRILGLISKQMREIWDHQRMPVQHTPNQRHPMIRYRCLTLFDRGDEHPTQKNRVMFGAKGRQEWA